MINLGTLKEITDLRSVWQHEALNFTPWIAENVDLLGDAIGLDITVDETESQVGNFNVDIYAFETGTDRKIIIENQLEDTDHDHLGKLITYASGKDAEVIIWIVKHAREEHKAAIEWLNNHTDDRIGFFLCEIKLFQIGESEIAPSFTVVERPNDWAKEIKKIEYNSVRHQKRMAYWTAFNEYAFKNMKFAKQFNPRKPSTNHWMDMSIGTSVAHLGITMIQKKNETGVELYINDDKELFKSLYEMRELIEKEAGLRFDWQELPTKKASRILITNSADFEDSSRWPQQFDWIMDMLVKMKLVFKKYL